MAIYKAELTGTSKARARKRRFNKHYKKAFSFALEGFDKKGDRVYCRCYVVRSSRGRPVTIDVRQNSPDPDPEVEFILSTMRPLVYARGR